MKFLGVVFIFCILFTKGLCYFGNARDVNFVSTKDAPALVNQVSNCPKGTIYLFRKCLPIEYSGSKTIYK